MATTATKARRAKAALVHPSSALLWTAALWALTLAVFFFRYRQSDVGQLPAILETFSSSFGGLQFAALRDTLLGALTAVLIVCAWFGYGAGVEKLLRLGDEEDKQLPPAISWSMAIRCAWGAGFTSLLMFVLGLAYLHAKPAALAVLAAGLLLFGWAAVEYFRNGRYAASYGESARWTASARVLLGLICIPIVLGAIAALAPPIAKDALLYHISLPKAFSEAGGLADVRYNIAQYYALGAELNGTWAMLLGRMINLRVGEAAFGLSQFAYLPIVLLAVFGWMRKRGHDAFEALLPVALIAFVPTIYSSSSSSYNDCALMLYGTLVIFAAIRWWKVPDRRSATELGLALGLGLTVKLLALFIIAAVFVLFLLRLRIAESEAPGSVARALRTGVIAALFAAAVASPWYVRNWVRTGSPVYPFYMNIFHGSATGWDERRSFADQTLNSRYGGYPKGVVDYAAVPFRASLSAQPDIPRDFDGVLGISFLCGLLLLAVAMGRRKLGADLKMAAGLAGAYFVCWVFSSEQLRYLLPALPALAVSMVIAGLELDRRLRIVLLATAVPGLLVIVAWFGQQNPAAVVIGAEPRNAYLERTIDHYSIYETVNSQLPTNARVWLVNMRRDTYYIERPYFSDFRMEDYSLVKMVRESESAEDLRRRVREQGITHMLLRTDVLLDYSMTPIVDDTKPQAVNERWFDIFRRFLSQSEVIRKDGMFLLIKV